MIAGVRWCAGALVRDGLKYQVSDALTHSRTHSLTVSMRDSWRHFIAEFIGTFALVFVGGAAIMTAQMSRSENLLLTVAVAHGLILAVLVTATMRISGRPVISGR